MDLGELANAFRSADQHLYSLLVDLRHLKISSPYLHPNLHQAALEMAGRVEALSVALRAAEDAWNQALRDTAEGVG